MNLIPIYELRNRLRIAMIAGTNLLSEDFRLKRAVEDIKPLESLSPVFAKINQMASMLLSDSCENREGILIDTITLVDALLCTQGQVAVTGEIEPITTESCGSVVINAPYSVVKKLVEALTKSGEGRYQFVLDTHKEKPELFSDYRVKSAMVLALGASYAELADKVAEWLKEESVEIVPLLKKDINPKGKKEMVRRIQVMEAVAGGTCNDFYLQMLPEAEREVKNALIYALRHHKENVELLLQLAKKEKGNAKKMAYFALAAIEDERIEKLFREMYEKKPIDTMIYLCMTSANWAAKMVSECFIKQLEICREPEYGKGQKAFTGNETEILRMTIEALPAKKGSEICEAFRRAFEVDEIYLKNLVTDKISEWGMHVPRRCNIKLEIRRFAGAMAYFLESAIRINPDEDLCALAEALYEKKSVTNKNIPYFSAALTAQLLGKEDCSEWLRKQLFVKEITGVKRIGSINNYLANGLKGLIYDEDKETYILQTHVRDIANDVVNIYEQPVTQDIEGKFTELLMEYSALEVDKEIISFLNTKNKELCKKLEEYFYKKAGIVASQDCPIYWAALQKCGSERCEGLLVNFVKKDSSQRGLSGWDIYSSLWKLPGTAEAFEKEAMEVHKLISEGKVKVNNWNETTFFQYVENVKEKKRKQF